MTNFHIDPTIGFILGRRSVRKFLPNAVIPEMVTTLLECAFAAPSAHNRRPLHFIVVDDRATLDALAKAHDSGKAMETAPLAIAVCADTSIMPEGDMAWIEDAAAAMENILIAARALGLEGVWLKVMDRHPREERVTPLFGAPPHVKIVAIAVLGYGDEAKDPYRGVNEERIHRNVWG